ncbi:Transcriptional regulator [Minicystis rosea]|nr:Transcriptional regulator [Minicystis rosea]
MRQPAITELRAAVAVASHLSFRAAARELRMSPSALSHAIAVLEERLGVRLFHRTTRSVALTPAGERFFERVGPALREIAEAVTSAGEARGEPAGTLRINASSGAARYVLLPLVLAYSRRYPRVQVELTTENRFVDLVAEGYDLGVRTIDTVPKDMIAVPCSPPIRFAVVGAPSYFETRPRPTHPSDLRDHACLRLRSSRGTPFPWDFERSGQELALDVQGPLLFDDDELILLAARRGAGLAYTTEWAIKDDVRAGTLVRVLREWTPPYPGLCLFYPGHRLVPATVRAFVALCRAPKRAKKKP